MTRQKLGLAVGAFVAVAVPCAIGVAIVAVDPSASWSHPAIAAQFVLLAGGSAAVVALRRRRLDDDRVGPGVYVSAIALTGALLLALHSKDERLAAHRGEVTILFALAVAAFLLGALLHVGLCSSRSPRREQPRPVPNSLRSTVIVLCATAFLGLALVNFATGSIPLLASNIDATRFAGGGGAFAQLWIWIIGGIEWLLVVAGVQRVVFGRLNRSSWCIVIVGLGILTLLASRSFFLIVGLALLVAYASVKRVTISRLAIVGVAGLLVLGATGSARVHHSDPTGARQQFLQSQRIDSVYGTISQSAATGPVVLATVLDNVPALFQYQHGRFALRDFRALLPLHPLGRPEQSGIWVTDAILHRDPTQIGGSPPTLVGGLYIDFGVTGIALGSLLLGFCLVAMHRWARSSRTIGSLTAYSYASAYIALSAYSYVSVKPTVVLVGVLSLMAHRMELRSAHRARRRVADEHPGVAIAPGASRA